MRGAKEESLPGRPDTSFFFLSLVLLLGLIDSVGERLQTYRVVRTVCANVGGILNKFNKGLLFRYDETRHYRSSYASLQDRRGGAAGCLC